MMNRSRLFPLAVALVLAALPAGALAQASKKKKGGAEVDHSMGYDSTPVLPGQKWRVHDIARPHPRVVAPGTESSPQRAGRAPSDAIVLFDGKDLSQWMAMGKGKDAKLMPPAWKVENGYMEVVSGAGSLVSKEKFGDCQIHVEWASPDPPADKGQWRGNSGVMIMSRYEIQILDSYKADTYADGQAASIYGQWPPLVNASRAPGEWQSYDIVFEAPRFEGDKLAKPAFVTIFHNGVLMHHHKEIMGGVVHAKLPSYKAHAPEEPIMLQNHNRPARYRSMWVRRLTAYDQQ